jgi:hypothetical protein
MQNGLLLNGIYNWITHTRLHSNCHDISNKHFIKIKKHCFIMPKKLQPNKPEETTYPKKIPEITPVIDPQEPVIPQEDPDIIPDENPFKNPAPFEMPEPGEGT